MADTLSTDRRIDDGGARKFSRSFLRDVIYLFFQSAEAGVDPVAELLKVGGQPVMDAVEGFRAKKAVKGV